jgi:hypothetical protein
VVGDARNARDEWELFEVVPGHHLPVVALAATLEDDVSPDDVVVSHEHSDLRWFPVGALPDELPTVYRDAVHIASSPAD